MQPWRPVKRHSIDILYNMLSEDVLSKLQNMKAYAKSDVTKTSGTNLAKWKKSHVHLTPTERDGGLVHFHVV